MEIKKHYSVFFKDKANGIILDNAYDIYTRNRYFDYVQKNQIDYIYSQDIDMNLISFFPKIKFLTVPQEAQNLQQLYQLKELKGLEIFSSELEKIDLTKFENLEMLSVRGAFNNLENIESCKNLTALSCEQCGFTDLLVLRNIKRLERLELFFCKKLQSLKGIETQFNLKELCLNYCLSLRDVSSLKELQKNIKTLKIFDCSKIENLSVLNYLYNLQNLTLLTTETRLIGEIPSVNFVERQGELKEFVTNYKILDNDLRPLLKVDKVDLLKFYKGYNLTEKDFKKRINKDLEQ